MPAFPKPKFPYAVNVTKEKNNLRKYRDTKPGRQIPAKNKNKLLLATWNIANLGLQKREREHYQLLAEIISWFDLVAIQEVNDNLEGLRGLQNELPKKYKAIFTDEGGNNERMCYLYDSDKIQLLEKIGELSIPPTEYKYIKIDGFTSAFNGFDRNPYLATFKVKSFEFLLLSVHLYYGKNDVPSIERRCLETFCVARWADLRRKSKYCYTPNIMALGDFNLPKAEKSDPIYKALVSKGLELPDHSSKIYSAIASDSEYDQIAFFPGIKSRLTGQGGVFDYDGGIFPDLYQNHTEGEFKTYLRYYLSDHRPLWMELDVTN
jgi:endonuclease/exonuclease/phosphatase family metal-dependent hydrolase